ncbi:hypothetical protein [Polyangium aurulentum]|uniref:hypothetical protein n=1 Tax=Polyangium aurulentum TaxID=2567896 RepID=UPI00146BDDB6|nr:hypothetical protein [Polyangium aurulentum]UQA61079.1 hypothetical protein E8A73_011610 [Polyangium aurulentum]
MPDPIKPAAIGALAIDCSSLASFLVDLPPGGMRGLRVEHEGFQAAVAEVVDHQFTFGTKAGIPQSDVDLILLMNERIAHLDAFLPAAKKLVEMLEETRAKLDDQRQRQLHAIAGMVEGRVRATGDTELLAKYEKARAYRSAIAVKAAKTRKKNAQAAASTSTPPNPPTP